MTGSKFRVNTEQLAAVRDQASKLLKTLDGSYGHVPGSYPDFATATEQGIAQGIAPLWNNSETDPFSTGYKYEHDGMMKTLDSMKTQLSRLVSACDATVKAYEKKETDSIQTVQQTTSTTAWGK